MTSAQQASAAGSWTLIELTVNVDENPAALGMFGYMDTLGQLFGSVSPSTFRGNNLLTLTALSGSWDFRIAFPNMSSAPWFSKIEVQGTFGVGTYYRSNAISIGSTQATWGTGTQAIWSAENSNRWVRIYY